MLKLLARLAVVGALGAVVYGTWPDIKRYLEMSRM